VSDDKLQKSSTTIEIAGNIGDVIERTIDADIEGIKERVMSGVPADLAVVEKRRSIPSFFEEGKHYCKLRSVFIERSFICFKLEIVKSRHIAAGVEVMYKMPTYTMMQARIATAQLDRLGIDPAINGMLDRMDMSVVVIAVNKLRKSKIDGSQSMYTSINIRKPDETDIGEELL
jgi:hypothetical protein